MLSVFNTASELINLLSSSSIEGIILLLGKTDTGKTTFAKNLIEKIIDKQRTVALVDSDVGQSTIGPPTTIGLKIIKNIQDLMFKDFDRLYFVGSTSPRGHFLPMIIGTYKLVRISLKQADVIIIDTTGLVCGNLGFILKYYKIELIVPNYIVLFERENELKPYKDILQHNNVINAFLINVSSEVIERSYEQRAKYREKRFKEYFTNAVICKIDLKKVLTFPTFYQFKKRAFKFNILGFETKNGILLGIGIFLRFVNDYTIEVFSPPLSLDEVYLVKLGFTKVDFLIN